MVFHRGFRLRTELYGQMFQSGIIKTTTIILHTIKTLDGPEKGGSINPRDIIPKGIIFWVIHYQCLPKMSRSSFRLKGCNASNFQCTYLKIVSANSIGKKRTAQKATSHGRAQIFSLVTFELLLRRRAPAIGTT
jgi:hypothetical protein